MKAKPLKVLDLFSGGGGFTLAAESFGAFETLQFVEKDPAAQKVLKSNYPEVPIHDNVTTFTATLGQFDLITAGFPCQDISIAGHGPGLDGERSGLFYEIIRIIRECRPRYVLLENVAALTSSNRGRDMAAVLWELFQSGYDAEWQIIPASALGANHERERIWIIAYPTRHRRETKIGLKNRTVQNRQLLCADLKGKECATPFKCNEFSWPPRLGGISAVPRMDDGLSPGLD